GSVLLALLCGLSARASEVRFNEHIRPLLAENCLACHGPDESQRAADLRLDIEEGAKLSAIVPHAPDDSELILRATSDDPDLRMPPPDTGKQLSAEQIELLRRWIAEGARYEGHWAFEPIRMPELPPPVEGAENEIDRFIMTALQEKGLSLAPRISREQWIRRATFDLIGLPPTWEEVEEFVNDTSPQAYEKVLD